MKTRKAPLLNGPANPAKPVRRKVKTRAKPAVDTIRQWRKSEAAAVGWGLLG